MSEGKCTGWRKSSYSNSSGNCVEVAAGDWCRSSHCDGTGNCVEVRDTEHLVGVRDTKQGDHGPILEFTAFAWRKFLAETKNDQLNR